MNRTVRNGLAVATMAGGIWLLGQAVASASDVEAESSADNGTSVTQVENPGTAGGGGAAGASAGNTAPAQGGTGGSTGNAGSGTVGEGSSGDVAYSGTGGPGGDASIQVVSSGDTSATGGTVNSGGTTATSTSTGGSSEVPTSGGPDLTSSSVEGPSGSGSGSTTTVIAPGTATGGTAVGASATNHGKATGGEGGSTGDAYSGDVCEPQYYETASLTGGSGGWPEECSGHTGDVHYTGQGGAGGDASIHVEATGNTSATGGTITQGPVDASSDSESTDVDDFLDWLGWFLRGQEQAGLIPTGSDWWWNGNSESGTLVVVPNVATGGTATGTRATNSGNAHGGNGGDVGNAGSGDTSVTVICFSFTKDNHCVLDASSGTVTYHGVGGDGGAATIDVRSMGNTTATGGSITSGSVSGSSSATGYGADAFTKILGGNAAGGGTAIGTSAGNSGSAYGGNGGDVGDAWSGDVDVTLICISWKGSNNCSAAGHSGDVSYHGVGGKGGDAVITVVASGCTAATGGTVNGAAAHIGDLCPAPAAPAAPAQPASPAPTAPVQHVAPVASGSGSGSGSHATTVSASHSSAATLAYTGADVSDALGLGLLALTGGLGLALAGRRRSAA